MFSIGGTMRPLPLTVFVAALALGSNAIAQDEPVALASSSFSSFEKGDGILSLSIGTVVPLGFYNPDTPGFENANSTPGFAFALSYAGFLNESWALAGDLAGGYISTVNDDHLFIAPLSLRMIRAFPIGSFIIAPTAGIGMAISALGTDKHIDGLFKAGSSFYWKASTDMSYALNLFANVIPQIMTEFPENTRVGFFMEATLSVAYHL
jgi:hypothetical protein